MSVCIAAGCIAKSHYYCRTGWISPFYGLCCEKTQIKSLLCSKARLNFDYFFFEINEKICDHEREREREDVFVGYEGSAAGCWLLLLASFLESNHFYLMFGGAAEQQMIQSFTLIFFFWYYCTFFKKCS